MKTSERTRAIFQALLVAFLWLGGANTAFAFYLWNVSLQHLSAMESSLINNTRLIQIAALSWIFLANIRRRVMPAEPEIWPCMSAITAQEPTQAPFSFSGRRHNTSRSPRHT